MEKAAQGDKPGLTTYDLDMLLAKVSSAACKAPLCAKRSRREASKAGGVGQSPRCSRGLRVQALECDMPDWHQCMCGRNRCAKVQMQQSLVHP